MKKLYVFRPQLVGSRVVAYEQVENDLYKDTTCSDHKNCVVRIIKNENGNYKIIEYVNDEAKKYHYFHDYTTPLFETSKEAIIAYANLKIQEYNKDIDKKNAEMTNLKAKIKELEQNELIVNAPRLSDFDFDDIVYLARTNEPNSDILTFKVAKKVFDKNGLLEIQSDDYDVSYNEYGDYYTDGYCVNRVLIFTDDDGKKFNAFKDRISAENSLKKLEIQLLKKELKHCENSIKNYEKYIEKCNKAKKDAK